MADLLVFSLYCISSVIRWSFSFQSRCLFKTDLDFLGLLRKGKDARLRSAVGSVSDSRARGPGFDTQSGHILSFLLLLVQEVQLSVTAGNTLEGDVSDVIALDQLTSPFSPLKATRMSP